MKVHSKRVEKLGKCTRNECEIFSAVTMYLPLTLIFLILDLSRSKVDLKHSFSKGIQLRRVYDQYDCKFLLASVVKYDRKFLTVSINCTIRR